MDPLTIVVGVGLAALALSKPKESTVYQGGTRVTLTPGNYRARFLITPVDAQATPLMNIFAMPHMTLSGLGLVSYFESLTVDPKSAANSWTITALSQYAGQSKQIDLLPGMTLERLT